MDSTKLNIALVLLQLTGMCMCQKLGAVYRRPVIPDRQIALAQQQFANEAAQQSVTAGDVYQQYPEQQYNYPTQPYYYPPQQKLTLEKQQQARLEQQQLQLQQLQQLQSPYKQHQQQQQPLQSVWDYYQPAAAAASPQQYSSEYQQQLLQQLQQQQQSQQPQQQQYYQTMEKPLFRPATIPVNEAPAEGPQQQKPNLSLYQQQNGASASQQLPQNPLGVYYSSAADVSKFQFSGNGVSYSY
ncbi:putative cyclin-dependent serine/threonine-protein kinase DDB_G0272797/DDB_G0274007 [Aphis gossypii]|uniref:putative cyclin-dependent serine/threonine-protein kinase DDB_G0272797/DDB_G0274007 n=1 Tax=Aphis gossypii TaxID=80765 RepID=UPI002158B2FA|nr:putative cyclin-dependent serine/threonine-protein kinase DDB_G0272797/DDB_G0274007 [Aphis gossypii]